MRYHTEIKVWTNTSNELTTTPNELTTKNEFTITKIIELREQTGELFKIHKFSHTALLLI